MTFFDPLSKKDLLLASIEKKKMLLGPEDFNNVSDYLLLRKYIKRIVNVMEIDNYVIAKVNITVGDRKFERYLIIGFDENDKIVTFYDSHPYDGTPRVFGFDIDVARFNHIDINDLEFHDIFMRVQGDIVFQVERIENALTSYLDSLFTNSWDIINGVLFLEIHRRIGDALSELSITSTVGQNGVAIRGCPKNIKFDKILSYIARNLILSDIFHGYECVNMFYYPTPPYRYEITLRNNNNEFVLALMPSTEERAERVLHIHAAFRTTLETRIRPIDLFFENLTTETELIRNISEIEIEERVGRHIITFKNVYPRGINVEYVFPISQRRYNIMLTTRAFVTSGTEIMLSHPQHGTKVIKTPASRIWLRHVEDVYRTTAIKNKLLLRHYFT